MKTTIIVSMLFLFGFSFACEVDPELVQLAIDVAKQEGIQPELLIALVWIESRFCPDAISPAGAIGLGQLMPGTAKELGVDPYSAKDNLSGSASYIAQQLKRFNTFNLALAAYNAGPRRVKEANGIPDITETQEYITKVSIIYLQLLR